jgi:hypothetical protein
MKTANVHDDVQESGLTCCGLFKDDEEDGWRREIKI